MAVNIAVSARISSTGALNPIQSASQLVRTSNGNLYAFLISPTTNKGQMFKSIDNGNTWTLQDQFDAPALNAQNSTFYPSIAIDGIDVIHIAYIFTAAGNNGLNVYIQYVTSTDTFGIKERFTSNSGLPKSIALAIDSNNKPHIIYADTTNTLSYFNRIGGSWIKAVTIGSNSSQTNSDIQIDQNNVPQISVVDGNGAVIVAYLGNKNNASSFSSNTLASSFTAGGGSSLVIDPKGNTWVAWQSAKDGPLQLAKHKQTDAWSTWQTAVSDGFNGKNVSLAIDGTDIYIFYERNAGGLAYDRYNSVNGTWLGEQIIQANTSPLTTNKQWHNPFVKWSNYFDNGLTGANNQGQNKIEYLFDDGSTVYYAYLDTAQISTGAFSIQFTAPAAATTTSTSSTSSSTSTSVSTSTSSTSSSTSVSTSTSSTSASTSISTSSTSSSTSISTSSTSSSTSISSTSSSTSVSTSTSSTSSSTSISASTSTSSTSSSISTSSTSSSTSISTSSTSSSTSISTSSTSSSTSISSTSSSTSVSTSTSVSSTSSSTSVSTSTSHSSTSSSISTSSTSSSTSTSISSTSSSTSISTSSTSSSTSISSTSSSTSVSTSTSVSSTSSSTSTTVSLTTSTSSTSTSISTSSTSSSTSTSISSTSSSISTSTSSTSQSTSTSSTSSSTSTSHSTSTSSTSQSTSTSLTTSTSSTSSSTSTSVSFTTSTSSTSTSVSSTSTSTTTLPFPDPGYIPRATIRVEPRGTNLDYKRGIPRIVRQRLR